MDKQVEILPPAFDISLDDVKKRLDNERAHAVYQRALKEHLVFQRALDAGLIEASPDINKAFLRHQQDCRSRGVDPHAPQEVGKFVISLMINPSQRFPGLASAVEDDLINTDIQPLINIIDPKKNPKLKDLAPSSNTTLTVLAHDSVTQMTLRCERLHEHYFGTASRANGIHARLERWVESGVEISQKSCKYGILSATALATGPLGIASMSAVHLTKLFLDTKRKGLNYTLNLAFKAWGKISGKGDAVAANRREAYEGRLGVKKGSNLVVAPAIAVVSAAITLGALYSSSLTLEAHLPLIASVAEQVDGMGSPVKTVNDSKWGSVLAGGFMGILATKLQDKFDFKAAKNPFKSNPFTVEPAVTIPRESRSENKDRREPFNGPSVSQLTSEVYDSTAIIPVRSTEAPARTMAATNDTDAPNPSEPKEDASPSQASPGL